VLPIETHFLGPRFSVVQGKMSFKCNSLFYESKGSTWPPPRTIPPNMMPSYTLNNNIPVQDMYISDEQQNGGDGYVWSESYMKDMMSKPNVCGGYGQSHCNNLVNQYQHLIKFKRGVVLGSQTPWAEAALLAAGADHVATIEYQKISTSHPKHSAYHPDTVSNLYSQGKMQLFDFAFSFSSYEHDGLGRYGDPLNPVGDLESIARVHCLLKPDGVFFLGIPTGSDTVVWNAHRVYGRHRLALFLPFWEPIDLVGYAAARMGDLAVGDWTKQPIWVLKKKELLS
jgi:hypothetical protein